MKNLYTLDFETYYATDYTLDSKSKYSLPVSEYVRDPRFKAHGVAYKRNTDPADWVTHNDLPRFLESLDWKNIDLVCHHSHFDGFILSERYNQRPGGFHLDTLAMSRMLHQDEIPNDLGSICNHYGLPPKGDELILTKGIRDLPPDLEQTLADYAINDVERTYDIFNVMHPQVPDSEIQLIDLTTRLFTDPILQVNTPRAQAEMEREIEATQALIRNCGVPEKVLSSNKQFAEFLEHENYPVPTKISPTTGKSTFAFGKNDLAFKQLVIDYPELADIVAARLAVKSTITVTRAGRLINHCPPGRALPIYLLYWGAHTGRWSGGDKLNPQNFTRGGELRKSIIAPDGHVLVVWDLSQIECRTLAELAGETELVEAFRQKRDVYSEYASDIFGYHVNRKLKDENGISPQETEGFVGKVAVLGLGYGMGDVKFDTTLRSGSMGKVVALPDPGMPKRIVEFYRTKNQNIVALWRILQGFLARMIPQPQNSLFGDPSEPDIWTYKCLEFGPNYVKLPNGTKLKYPKLKFENGQFWYWGRDNYGYGWKKIYGGLLTENIVQALARIIIADAMLEINKRYRVVLSTHDEVVAAVPAAQAEEAFQWGLEILRTPPIWMPNIPLDAEGGYAVEYSK